MIEKGAEILKSVWIKNVFLITLTFFSFWVILSVQLQLIPLIECFSTEESAQAMNTVLLTLAYSYVAALVFYLVTNVLPAKQRKNKIAPVVNRKVRDIGKCISDILLEFSRGTNYGYDIHNTSNTEMLLKSKDWHDNIPMIQEVNRISIDYLRYMVRCGELMKSRISDLIIKYHEEMTASQLLELENLSETQFFKTIGFICTIPGSNIADSGYMSLINEFIKMQKQYMRVEEEFGIYRKL